MQRDERLDIPALFPLIGYVAGLALGPVIVDARSALIGSAVVSLLLAVLKRPRAALVAMLFATGLALALEGQNRARAEENGLAEMNPERFTSVAVPVTRGWRHHADGNSTLIAERFTVAGERSFEIRRTLVVSTAFQPLPVAEESRILAEGFLRCSGEVCYLSIKSPRLLRYEGAIPWWTPAGANRRMNNALSAIAERDPRQRRAVVLSQALALGRSDQLPDDVRESYRRGGIYHLLVFSGMQIGIAAWALSAAFRRLRAPAAGDWALLGLSILAPFFAGNEPSVARAAWMIGLYSLSRLMRRPTSIENLLFVSALIRLIAHPDELTDAGFALTYAAAGGLLIIGGAFAGLAAGGSSRATSGLLSAARALLYGLGAEMATLPLTLFFFHQYVAAGSVVTLIASPLLAVMLASAAIAAAIAPFSTSAAVPFLAPVHHLDTICTSMSSLVGDRLGLAGMAAAPTAALLCVVFLFLLLIQPFLHRRGRAASALALLLPVLASAAQPFRDSVSAPTLELLDVGQGDAVLLRTKSGAILIDGGGRSDDPRWGRRFLPLLLDRGVSSLDAIALTHPDPDHCAGLVAVMEHLPVRELWIREDHLDTPCGKQLVTRAEGNATTLLIADRIRDLRRIGVPFEVITPRLRFKRARWNNGSLVLRARIDGRHILLTGDIEREAERLHGEEMGERLRADVLKVPHHGSRSSSTAPFLDAVRPRVALVSCGRRNRFGHPAAEVLERLSSAVVVARTDLQGSITLRFEGGKMFVRREFDTPRTGI